MFSYTLYIPRFTLEVKLLLGQIGVVRLRILRGTHDTSQAKQFIENWRNTVIVICVAIQTLEGNHHLSGTKTLNDAFKMVFSSLNSTESWVTTTWGPQAPWSGINIQGQLPGLWAPLGKFRSDSEKVQLAELLTFVCKIWQKGSSRRWECRVESY